jgi:Ca2+/Na+ antiporter
MWKKVIPNTLYNIGIFISIIAGYQYGIVQHHYGYIVSAVLIIAIFIALKIKILKEIKNPQKKS